MSAGWNKGVETGIKRGNVPTERIAPILYTLIRERWPHGNGLDILSEKVGCDPGAIAGIIDQENAGVGFDLADSLLCALGRWDIWHGVLEDVYPTKFIETCALPGCSKTFPELLSGGRVRHYCSCQCRQLAYRMRRGDGTGMRLRKRGYCLKGHRLSPDNLLPRKNGARECRKCSVDRHREYQRNWKKGLVGAKYVA